MAVTYDAFISYSHAADGKLAPALQNALQRFAKPWYRLRALHLFRDQTSLSATPGLWPAIEAALKGSRYFLLLASPEAAKSRWVQQEVEWWLEHKSPETMLIALTDGKIARHPGATDFDWSETEGTTALPPNLKGVFTENPLWVDFRWAKGTEQLSTKNPEFQNALAALAAPLRNLPKENLISEDVAQHRRAMILARGATVVLVLLLIAAIGAAFLALRNQAEAEVQRDEARRQANIAQSRALAAQAVNQVDNQLDLAHLLSLESLASADTAEARGSVLTGLVANPQLARYLHDGPPRVYSLDVSPDGKRIAAAGYSGAITIWDASTGQPLGPLAGEVGDTGVAFAPDSRTLASYGGHGVTLWDVESRHALGSPLSRSGQSAGVSSLAFSPDSATIATTRYEGTVDIWDVASRLPLGEPLAVDEVFADILVDAVFSPDGSILAIGSRDGTILLWDVEAGRQRGLPLEGQGPVNQLAFSPDGRTLAAAGDRVILWNLEERVPSEPLVSDVLDENAMFVESYLAFSPDGALLAIATCSWLDGYSECSASDIRFWDVARRQPLGPPLLEQGSDLIDIGFTSVAFNPEGNQLVSGTTHKGVLVWHVSSTQPPAALVVEQITLPEELPSSIFALSPDGTSLAFAALEGSEVVVWDVADNRQQAALTGFTGRVTSLAYGQDGTMLAAAACGSQADEISCEQSEIRLWEVKSGAASGSPLVVDDEFVSSLAFSPDGSILATSGGPDNGITLWDVVTGLPRQSPLTGHERVARVLAFSPDGATLASGGGSTIFLWNVADGQRRMLPERHTDEVLSLAFSADGTTLASGGRDNVIRIWDVGRGTSVGPPLIGHQAAASGALGYANAGVFALGFVSDGKTLISGGNDRTVRLWDVTRRQPIGPPLIGHRYSVTHLVLTSDNTSVVSAGQLGEVIVYDIDLDSWRHRACERANRNLSEEEWALYLSPAPYQATCAAFPVDPGTPVAEG